MTGLRPFNFEDLLEIKDNLVEGNKGRQMTPEIAKSIAALGRAYTYLKDGCVVACVGEAKIEPGIIDIWAFYSNKFPAITRARAALEFKKLTKDIVGKARTSIPSDLPNGKKYAEFLGFKFISDEASKVFNGIKNSVFEVA